MCSSSFPPSASLLFVLYVLFVGVDFVVFCVVSGRRSRRPRMTSRTRRAEQSRAARAHTQGTGRKTKGGKNNPAEEREGDKKTSIEPIRRVSQIASAFEVFLWLSRVAATVCADAACGTRRSVPIECDESECRTLSPIHASSDCCSSLCVLCVFVCVTVVLFVMSVDSNSSGCATDEPVGCGQQVGTFVCRPKFLFFLSLFLSFMVRREEKRGDKRDR